MNMNIEQYIVPELLLSVATVGVVLLVFLCFRVANTLNRVDELHDVVDEDDDKPFVPRPFAGQLWYTRTGDHHPFINKEIAPVTVLEYRANVDGEWIRFMRDGEEFIENLEKFRSYYTHDEFNDMVTFRPAAEEELEIEVELEEDKPAANPFQSMVSIEGKNYILSPVS